MKPALRFAPEVYLFTKHATRHSATPARAAEAGIEPAGNVFNRHAVLPAVPPPQSCTYQIRTDFHLHETKPILPIHQRGQAGAHGFEPRIEVLEASTAPTQSSLWWVERRSNPFDTIFSRGHYRICYQPKNAPRENRTHVSSMAS